jgi:hypothetical protein
MRILPFIAAVMMVGCSTLPEPKYDPTVTPAAIMRVLPNAGCTLLRDEQIFVVTYDGLQTAAKKASYNALVFGSNVILLKNVNMSQTVLPEVSQVKIEYYLCPIPKTISN